MNTIAHFHKDHFFCSGTEVAHALRMKNTKPNYYTSEMSIIGSGIRIMTEISSRHNKAYRRNFLQALSKAIHAEMKFMNKYSIVHEDSDPLNQMKDILRAWSLKQGIQINTTQRELGFLIREKRTSLGFSQETFAKILQIDRTYVSKLEHGSVNPSLALMRRIHELGNPPHALLQNIRAESPKRKFTSAINDAPVLH